MWQALKICVRVAQPASRHEKKQLHVSFYDSVHEIPVDQNGRWLNPSIQQKVEGLICYDPMWWGWGELGARLNPRNHKPVRMFNAQNHRGGSSKMLVKRWSSNIQHTFCQSVTGANKTFSTKYESFWDTPRSHGFLFKGTWLEPWAKWNAFRPCFSTKCWKAQFSVLVKNARGLDGWLGGKRRKQHLSRSLESGSLRLVVLFVLIWRMFFFFARKLRHEARYSSLDLN